MYLYVKTGLLLCLFYYDWPAQICLCRVCSFQASWFQPVFLAHSSMCFCGLISHNFALKWLCRPGAGHCKKSHVSRWNMFWCIFLSPAASDSLEILKLQLNYQIFPPVVSCYDLFILHRSLIIVVVVPPLAPPLLWMCMVLWRGSNWRLLSACKSKIIGMEARVHRDPFGCFCRGAVAYCIKTSDLT